VQGVIRTRSPIESVRERAYALLNYLQSRLTETRTLFDDAYVRLKFWVGSFVIISNQTADVSGVSDSRVEASVVRLSRLSDDLFLSAYRPPWAKELSDEEIRVIADAIYRPMVPPIVGLDFGTSNSAVAYFTQQERIEIFHVAEERVLLPSLFAYEENRKQVGLEVENTLQELDQSYNSGLPPTINPRNVVFWIKKLLGRTYQEYLNSKEEYPYVVKRGKDDTIIVRLDNKNFTPEKIAVELLSALYDLASSRLGDRIEAVIPVPVRFTDRQRSSARGGRQRSGLRRRSSCHRRGNRSGVVLGPSERLQRRARGI